MFPMNSMLAFELQIPMQVEKVFMASSQSVIDFEPGELCVLPPPSWNLNDCNFGGPVVSWIYSWMAANRFCLAKVLLWLMCTLSENNNLFDSTWLTNNTWEGKHKVGLELSPDRVGLKLLQLIPRGDNMTIVRVCVWVYPTCLQTVALVHTLVVHTGGVLASTHHTGILLLLWTQDRVTAGFLYDTQTRVWTSLLKLVERRHAALTTAHIFWRVPRQLLTFLFFVPLNLPP